MYPPATFSLKMAGSSLRFDVRNNVIQLKFNEEEPWLASQELKCHGFQTVEPHPVDSKPGPPLSSSLHFYNLDHLALTICKDVEQVHALGIVERKWNRLHFLKSHEFQLSSIDIRNFQLYIFPECI